MGFFRTLSEGSRDADSRAAGEARLRFITLVALNRDQLIDLVKGGNGLVTTGVSAQMMRLRKKTERDPSNSSLVKTVRSSGYVFAAAAVGITLPSTNVRSPGSYDG
jgi:hypothetical protein